MPSQTASEAETPSTRLLAKIACAEDLPGLQTETKAAGKFWWQQVMGELAGVPLAFPSTIADTLTRRLTILAEQRLGPPPLPYAWITYGSQGRQENTLSSDQDNALVIDDKFDPALHDNYFAALAETVCDGLAACGFRYCPGGMMATNPAWRQSLSGWQKTFSDWIQRAAPQTARLASNLFDFRSIAGTMALATPLRALILGEAPTQQSFLGHLVANACSAPAALSLFGKFVVDKSPEHQGEIPIKLHGILPIVDLARIYSLMSGIEACSTSERLLGASGKGLLSEAGARQLVAAYEFLLNLRMRRQARQLADGLPPSNHLPPASLAPSEARQLRDAFRLIETQRNVLRLAYPEQSAN